MVRPHSWALGVQTPGTYVSMDVLCLWLNYGLRMLTAIHLFKARKHEVEPKSFSIFHRIISLHYIYIYYIVLIIFVYLLSGATVRYKLRVLPT